MGGGVTMAGQAPAGSAVASGPAAGRQGGWGHRRRCHDVGTSRSEWNVLGQAGQPRVFSSAAASVAEEAGFCPVWRVRSTTTCGVHGSPAE